MRTTVLICMFVASLTACSNSLTPSQPPATQEIWVPLEKLTGERIAFEMCGKKVSLPRKSVVALRTNEKYGLTSGRIVSVGVTWRQPNSEGGATEFEGGADIRCNGPIDNATRYFRPFDKGIGNRIEHPEIGLVEFSRSPDQWGFVDGYFQPISSGDGEDTFTFQCDWKQGSKKKQPCVIRGVVHHVFNVHFSAGGKDLPENWRELENIYTGFIKSEG
jgi:hypothetical protein